VANSFSGGQCFCTAEKIRRIRKCAHQNFLPRKFGSQPPHSALCT
jgi:hypothetical protein